MKRKPLTVKVIKTYRKILEENLCVCVWVRRTVAKVAFVKCQTHATENGRHFSALQQIVVHATKWCGKGRREVFEKFAITVQKCVFIVAEITYFFICNTIKLALTLEIFF